MTVFYLMKWISARAVAGSFLVGALLVLYAAASAAAEGKPLLLTIEGLTGKELANVRAALTFPPGLVEKGKVDETWLSLFEEQIPAKVREALQPFGYYQPEVNVRAEEKDGGHRIVVRVEAGKPVKITALHVEVSGPGAKEPAFRKIVEAFPLAVGGVLQQDIYEQAKENLLKKASDAGYLGAFFSKHAIKVSTERLTAEVELELATGPLHHFGEVTFKGTPSYPETFLRRFLEFKPGDVFSYEKIAKTQANFANADRFRQISVTPRKEAAVGDRVPVEITLTPSKAKNVRTGIGYGTDTGPRATLRYRDANVWGLGQELESEVRYSPVIRGASAKYIFPGIQDTKDYTALTTAAQREDTTSYVSQWLKAEAERARGFGGTKTGSVFLQARKENSDASDQSTNAFLLMPGLRFSELHYDNVLRPRKGYTYQAELKATHQSIGSSTGFIQFSSAGEMIVPLPHDFAFLTRARIGATWQNDPVEQLPISVRFFAGGDRSIRGYAYQALGPKNDQGNVVGGRNLLVGSAELERYIGKDWGVAAFYDVGNAFNNLSDISAAQGAGMGIRYYSPFGPIRLDVARQLGVAEPDTRIHLTIGVGL